MENYHGPPNLVNPANLRNPVYSMARVKVRQDYEDWQD